jgi:ribosome recycling factor
MNKEFEAQLKEVTNHLDLELKNIRTGRAAPSLVEEITVEAYGSRSPMKHIANIVTPDASSITIEPWDKSLLAYVEKAIRESDLGLAPANEGERIRLKLPPLTEERRAELVKVVKEKVEEAKISIRNHRESILKDLKAKKLSEDDEKHERDEVQKLVDTTNKAVETAGEQKTNELMNMSAS